MQTTRGSNRTDYSTRPRTPYRHTESYHQKSVKCESQLLKIPTCLPGCLQSEQNVYFAWSQNQWRSWMTMIKNDHDMWKAHPPSLSKYMFVRPFDFLTLVVNWLNMDTFLTSQQPTMFQLRQADLGASTNPTRCFNGVSKPFRCDSFQFLRSDVGAIFVVSTPENRWRLVAVRALQVTGMLLKLSLDVTLKWCHELR